MFAFLRSWHWLRFMPWLFIISVYCSLLFSQGATGLMGHFMAQVSIAATMALGSFVAGGTALGGGGVSCDDQSISNRACNS